MTFTLRHVDSNEIYDTTARQLVVSGDPENNNNNMADGIPNLESVYQGIHTLYNDPLPAAKEKAGQWLEEVQKSVSFASVFLNAKEVPLNPPTLSLSFAFAGLLLENRRRDPAAEARH